MSDIGLWVWLFSVIAATVLLVVAVTLRRFVRIGSEMALGVLLAGLPFLFIAGLSVACLVAAVVVHVWLLIMPSRLLMGRLEIHFLYRSTRRNMLGGLAVLIGVASVHLSGTVVPSNIVVVLWLSLSLAGALVLCGHMLWNTRHYKLRVLNADQSMANLPTVSVCIPARNEDHALTECLQAVLASDYPKLEILVLDDCSQDTTSTIIRSFAHDGVRFVQGDQPAMGWLGKNQAMQTLAQHASGDYLLFLDVDTHIGPQTISRMVAYTLQYTLHMVSVLPQSRLGATSATLLGTMEYFWRVALPLSRRRVPVSSKAWLIQADSLRSLGGFESVSRKIVPEASFATRLQRSYRFLVGDSVLGATTAKRWHSQIESSLRVSYPRLHRQPLAVLAVCAVLVGGCVGPFVAVAVALASGDSSVIMWLAIAASVILILVYYFFLVRTQPRSWLFAGLLWPVVILQEVAILVTSMISYEFGEVNWKGRNVCFPVLTPQMERQAWRQALRQKQSPARTE